MSPKSGGRAQRRQRRNLWISVLVVVAIAIGSFAAVFAAKWSPRLGLDLAGGVAVVYTAEGQHVSAGRPGRDRQHLEPPRQRPRRVGRAGPDDGQEPDLGLDPGRDERAAGAQPDRADGAHVLPPRRVLGLPRGDPEGLQGHGVAPRHRDDSRLFVVVGADRGQPQRPAQQQRGGRLHVEHRPAGPAVRGLPVDERRASRTTPTAPSCSPGSAARATTSPPSAACSGRPR